MNIFSFLTPGIYWLLIVMWFFILFFYVKRLKTGRVKGQLLNVLLIILAIDAFRTLFESVYFGAWYTSLAGFLPQYVYRFLVRPELVFISKILNAVAAAAVVIIILIYQWLSEEINKIRPEIPVLLCSGLSSNWGDGKKLAPGVKGFIVKPIIMKELSRKIREILDSERSTVYV